jgi:transposase-like protein
MKQRRSFSPEFRQEAVRLALQSDRPLSEVGTWRKWSAS